LLAFKSQFLFYPILRQYSNIAFFLKKNSKKILNQVEKLEIIDLALKIPSGRISE
jgi:hypothetical protein